MKLIFQYVKIVDQHVVFLFDMVVWDPVTKIWMSFCFLQVMFYFVLDVVDVDELDVKLVFEMVYVRELVFAGDFAGDLAELVF